VTRVATADKHIVAIGKHLPEYDAFDTGVFAVGPRFFRKLAKLERPSVSDGVTALLARQRAKVIDCSGLDWIDVDDAAALARAEAWLAERSGAAIAA
jgi:1L-myo-inositol 1-phosphate cytidylyltransferase